MRINIKIWLKSFAYFIIFLGFVILFYGFSGWIQARNDAPELKKIVQDMTNTGLGIDDLGVNEQGKNRTEFIIKVEDPNFFNHNGYDLSTAGAGATTITQSLSKRLAFEEFKPGYQKIRQTGYAMGLETVLNKDEIFILFLNTVHMGRFPTGWIKGFHRASKLQYRKAVIDISDDEFIALTSVMIAPSELRLDFSNPKRDERIKRIKKLISNKCTPNDHDDVWLDGCA